MRSAAAGALVNECPRATAAAVSPPSLVINFPSGVTIELDAREPGRRLLTPPSSRCPDSSGRSPRRVGTSLIDPERRRTLLGEVDDHAEQLCMRFHLLPPAGGNRGRGDAASSKSRHEG